MKIWQVATAALTVGTGLGTGLGLMLAKHKYEEQYKAATASHWRAVQAAKIDAETPAINEDELIHIRPRDPESVQMTTAEDGTLMTTKVVDGNGLTVGVPTEVTPITHISDVRKDPRQDNPYHTAVHAEVYASFAELSEEDYQEDDGRLKEQITMVYSDNEPQFFMQGSEVDVSDVMDMVGGTIVDDMRKTVREGQPFLWVRNNKTDIDYEVLFEQP